MGHAPASDVISEAPPTGATTGGVLGGRVDFSLRFFAVIPSFFARERAYRKPHLIHCKHMRIYPRFVSPTTLKKSGTR